MYCAVQGPTAYSNQPLGHPLRMKLGVQGTEQENIFGVFQVPPCIMRIF